MARVFPNVPELLSFRIFRVRLESLRWYCIRDSGTGAESLLETDLIADRSLDHVDKLMRVISGDVLLESCESRASTAPRLEKGQKRADRHAISSGPTLSLTSDTAFWARFNTSKSETHSQHGVVVHLAASLIVLNNI
jgi:hypothetical protein